MFKFYLLLGWIMIKSVEALGNADTVWKALS